ncbi:MAG: hypothetical protein R6X34_28055 [Chloroflexota bacterium]|jgi:hypothetical protein
MSNFTTARSTEMARFLGNLRDLVLRETAAQQQLPPVLTTRLTGGALRDSVFDHLVDNNYDKRLIESYRLSEVLIQWPSQHFYDGLPTAVLHPTPRHYY